MNRPLRADLVDACVLEVYSLVRDQGWLADRALERVLRREKRLYATERRAAAEAVYGILRTQGQLAWLARTAAGAPGRRAAGEERSSGAAALEPATLYGLWLARTGAAAPASAARRLGIRAGTLEAALDQADARIAAVSEPVERLAVEASLPRWIAERFAGEQGVEEARALALAMNERAPLTVRANLLRTDRSALQERLAGEGVAAQPTRYSPWGLVLEGHANAFALPSFQEGLFEIQDEGSQLVALAVGARPGQTVADACAGAGGKSLALAAEMHGKGSLHALDSDLSRLDEARRRARRAGVFNLRTREIPAGAEAEAALEDLAGRCDRVLVDAPCSGLGTLRRKPDARWRLDARDSDRFAALQKELVARFARLARPGGWLVYATCAIGPTENEQVALFMERELPGFSPLPLAETLGADLAHYRQMKTSAATEEARRQTRLIVGPWSHGMFLNVVGDLDFGLRSNGLFLDLREDVTALNLRWFGQRLKGIPTGIDDEPPVKLFVQGVNRWRYEDAWPLARAVPTPWYLGSDGRLGPEPPRRDEAADAYVYDPADPCPTRGGALLLPRTYPAGPVDQASILGRRDVLLYSSEPLPRDLEVTGPVKTVLYAATSARDTDWVVKLCDVSPNGRTYNVCDGILRARYRASWEAPTLIMPDAVERYEVDLWATSWVFLAGHRLRLLVTSSDFPRYDRNPNTGALGVEATTTAPAQQRIFHDGERASHVLLPVIP